MGFGSFIQKKNYFYLLHKIIYCGFENETEIIFYIMSFVARAIKNVCFTKNIQQH